MAELLLEVGLEEIPARMIAEAEAELARRVSDVLKREGLVPPESPVRLRSYATPRRLAVLVEDIAARQPDRVEMVTGPAWKIAFPDGGPSPAARAFARKAGVQAEDLIRISTPKGDYAAASVLYGGESAIDVLAASLAREIAGLSWPKSMYWRPGKPERFVRPLRWLVCLLNEEIVPLEFAGIQAGRVSYGHRVLHGDAPLVLRRPGDYESALEAGSVMAAPGARRDRIRGALRQIAGTIPGARWREDEALVEQVVHLTEWPTVLCGGFAPEFLALPDEILVTVMRDHQKYFAVEDAQGRLLPHFLAVLNTSVDSGGLATIRHGNERVLRARFNDARFFWDQDQKIPLVERVESLKAVTFQKELGSYLQKTEMNLRVAAALAAACGEGPRLDAAALEQAVRLAKTDLTTELVKEFPELQGIVGGLYARAQGLGEAVSQAITAQYMPVAGDDPIPATAEGRMLGLADRAATLAEMFAIGLIPSGSRDPFALRRAANGLVRILAESEIPLSLDRLTEIAAAESKFGQAAPRREALRAFLRERLEFYLRDSRGYAYDVVNAVLATGAALLPDILARAEALTQARGSQDFAAVAAACKRIRNILRQAGAGAAEASGAGTEAQIEVEVDRLPEPAEQALYHHAAALVCEVEELRAGRRYAQAMQRIATLRPYVDAFFDRVMVMTEDPALRRNRLALIAWLLNGFSRIADFSEIVPG